MRTKKLGLILAMLATLSMTLPVQAATSTVSSGDVVTEETVTPGDAETDTPVIPEEDKEETVTPGDAETEIPEETVTPGDAVTDLSGKTVNLALIVDITGSMSGYIRGVKNNLSDFVRFIEDTGVNFRISLIDYRDITCDEPTLVHTFDYSVWTSDADVMIEELNSLRVNGGGDREETVIDALGYLVNEDVMTFNSDAAKFAFVLTDVDYKNENIHGIKDMDEMIGLLNEKGIKVSVMTNPRYSSVYEDLTTKTGGVILPVSDFGDALEEYALSIIKATADSEVDETVVPVTGIEVSGPAEICPDFVYDYTVKFTPENATNKGVAWYTEDTSVAEAVYASGSTCNVRAVAPGTTKLVAVSSDGGYTYKFSITVSESAATTDSMLSAKFDKVMAGVGKPEVKTIEYRVTEDKEISAEESKEVFGGIKGTDKTFSFAFTDADGKSMKYKWTFEGGKVTDPTKPVDFGVEVGAGDEDILGAVGEAAADASKVDAVDVHFDHSGDLPGTASVTVAVGERAFAKDAKLYLYYYNPLTGELELEDSEVELVDGYATFDITHCSDYVLVSELLKDGDTDDGDDDDDDDTSATAGLDSYYKAPKTGDAGVMVYMMVALASVAAIVFTRKKVK